MQGSISIQRLSSSIRISIINIGHAHAHLYSGNPYTSKKSLYSKTNYERFKFTLIKDKDMLNWCSQMLCTLGLIFHDCYNKFASFIIHIPETRILENFTQSYRWYEINGLVQERHNSSELAMELSLSCTNPSKYELYSSNLISNRYTIHIT